MVIDSIRKAVLAGFGAQEKLKEFVEELVKKGELNESQAAKFVKEWSEKAEKSSEEFEKTLSDLVSKTMQKMNLPSREDIEKLRKEVESMSKRIDKIESP